MVAGADCNPPVEQELDAALFPYAGAFRHEEIVERLERFLGFGSWPRAEFHGAGKSARCMF